MKITEYDNKYRSIEDVIHIEDSWNLTIYIDSIEVVINTEDNWNMPIDSIEVVI